MNRGLLCKNVEEFQDYKLSNDEPVMKVVEPFLNNFFLLISGYVEASNQMVFVENTNILVNSLKDVWYSSYDFLFIFFQVLNFFVKQIAEQFLVFFRKNLTLFVKKQDSIPSTADIWTVSFRFFPLIAKKA